METLRELQLFLPPFAVDVIRLCMWLVFLMAIFIPLERFYALRSMKVFRKGFVADLGFYFLSSIVPRMLLVLPLSATAWMVHRLVPGGFYQEMGEMPAGLRFVLALVVEELGFYWGHRWMHEIPVLWRFHAIHHSPEEVDWLVHTHAHPIDLVFTRLCSLVPMYLLGLAQPLTGQLDLVPVFVSLVGTVWGFFIHANLRWRLGYFEWLLSSPAFHHWHHTNDGPAFLNKNYAALLPCVDKCFGTFHLPARKWPGRYGTDSPSAPGFLDQLLQPLLPAPGEGRPTVSVPPNPQMETEKG
jgi:sterol desaturase/sphingolipid hydroxylase (fatty acid hydroxylase superfamily)